MNWTAYASDLAVIGSPDTAPHNDNLQARGVLIAGQSADIAAGMSGKLLKVPYKTGQFVKSGAVLAQFDCTQQQAELDARKAAHATQSLSTGRLAVQSLCAWNAAS
ncbi:MAG: biotin/lipoyl-binding protein [Litorimonas sp.]